MALAGCMVFSALCHVVGAIKYIVPNFGMYTKGMYALLVLEQANSAPGVPDRTTLKKRLALPGRMHIPGISLFPV